MSRAFVCSLAGIAVTVVAWYGPWAWPAWPAFGLLSVVFGSGRGYHELEPPGRAAVLVVLITVNVASWAVVAGALWSLAEGLPRFVRSGLRRAGTGTNSS